LTKHKIGVVSLGCDKNRIDSEIMLGNLKDKFVITSNAEEADVIIVNTCGFIETSKQESINTILEMAQYKSKYECELLIVTGCLSQRYGKELMDLMPEIDIMLGVNDYDKLISTIEEFNERKEKKFICTDNNSEINEGNRMLTTDKSTAYVRISEGCNNFCTYCIIPKIRGKYRSRKMEYIVNEVEALAKSGVKEIILVAQDTTQYGIDLYGSKKLPQLIKKLSEIEGILWIRIMYCYIEDITDELIEEIASNSKVCKYLDIPIQHISDNILRAMGRRGRKTQIINTINKLKVKIPNISLRTSLIVGFPGETEEDFEELKQFVKDVRFENLGVFKYSPEEDTPAAGFLNQIDDACKEERERTVMLLQQSISKELNKQKINQVTEVLIEEFDGSSYIGRTEGMAPEIDGEIYINSEMNLVIGDIIKVMVIDALEYDLLGDVYYESCQ
jgi:ribosomal protein S12 methylthiotransferase